MSLMGFRYYWFLGGLMVSNLKLHYINGTKFIELDDYNYDVLFFVFTQIDSKYRKAFYPDNKNTAKNLIQKYSSWDNWIRCKDIVEKICKAIDNENSTHLSVSGLNNRIGNKPNPNNARGITQMVKCIVKYEGLLEKVKNGDGIVVNDLAKAVTWGKGIISKFSFASKFCTYILRYQFDSDQYCIYDNIVQGILPYYVYAYINPALALQYVGRNRSIVHKFKDEYKYDGYRELIDTVINASPLKTSNNPRQRIDLLLWYYYKGDDELIREAISSIPR